MGQYKLFQKFLLHDTRMLSNSASTSCFALSLGCAVLIYSHKRKPKKQSAAPNEAHGTELDYRCVQKLCLETDNVIFASGFTAGRG